MLRQVANEQFLSKATRVVSLRMRKVIFLKWYEALHNRKSIFC